MFDIGFQELLLVGVVALLVMGPERLPGAIRTGSLWLARLRRSFQQIKTEIEREINADEFKRQLHNDAIMKSLEQTKSEIEADLKNTGAQLKPDIENLQYDISDITALIDKHNAEKTKVGDEPSSQS
jgi:sec-independent protein translocase protein TatB